MCMRAEMNGARAVESIYLQGAVCAASLAEEKPKVRRIQGLDMRRTNPEQHDL